MFRKISKNSKYKTTGRITNLNELMEQDFIVLHGKVFHKGWFGSWQLRFAQNQIINNEIYKAKLKEEIK